MIEIAVSSTYDHYSNYNTIIMCGGFSEQQQLYVVSAQKGEGEERCTLLEVSDRVHHIELLIYFVPKSLPQERNATVGYYLPFDATLIVKNGEKELYNAPHKINIWGGGAITLNIEL